MNKFVLYKCTNSDELFFNLLKTSNMNFMSFANARCKNDPKFYQFCGTTEFNKKLISTRSDHVLCGHIYCKDFPTSTFYRPVHIKDIQFEGKSGNNSNMCDHRFGGGLILPSRNISFIPPFSICNGLCDSWSCEDEAICNGFRYGFYCKMRLNSLIKQTYIQPSQTCDNIKHCYNVLDKFNNDVNPDEDGCVDIKSLQIQDVCKRSETGRIVPLFNYTRCSSIVYRQIIITFTKDPEMGEKYNCGEYTCLPYCEGFKDQTNCTDIERAAISCKINGFDSSVSKLMVCSEDMIKVKMCDDGTDLHCINTSPSCTVHKHQICNDISDCNDKTDERNDACSSMTLKSCFRKYIHSSELRVPLAWIADGHIDCLDGKDEKVGLWQQCGFGMKQRFVVDGTNCSDVFICPTGPNKLIEFGKLCDGVESCGNENEICKITRNKPQIYEKLLKSYKIQNYKSSLHCLTGLSSLNSMTKPCCKVITDLYGMKIIGFSAFVLQLPDGTHDCRYMYGELYFYFSCLGYCKLSNCPLRNRQPLKQDSCPSQYPQRLYTLANNSFLTFVVRKDNTYQNDFFVCNNSFCIEYNKVCNLVDDCGDGSDEISCSNHFKCSKIEQFLPINQKCDARVDCLDFSDECNDECSKNIISKSFFKATAWTIGCIGILTNLKLMINTIPILLKCKKLFQLTNRILIILISLGDLTIGIYLIVIAIIDSVVYNDKYCFHQFEWLTSPWCSFFGILNTVGSQLSVFSMTILSIQRAVGINNSMAPPTSINKKNVLQLCLLVIFLLLSSFLIAAIPLIDSFEDFFVNGLAYDQSIPLFIGMIDKETHFRALRAYYGRMKYKTLKWGLIKEMIDPIFSHDYNLVARYKKNVHFYGNDGVCLFKYFVKKYDPQWAYTLVVLCLNMGCFLLMSLSYIAIGILTVDSTKMLTKTSGPTGKLVKARNKKMKQRIILIIATDFICWVPFVVVCFLHFFDIIEATPMYSIFSIILLPLNSVINPLIYSCELSVNLYLKESLKYTMKISGNIWKKDSKSKSSTEIETTLNIVKITSQGTD